MKRKIFKIQQIYLANLDVEDVSLRILRGLSTPILSHVAYKTRVEELNNFSTSQYNFLESHHSFLVEDLKCKEIRNYLDLLINSLL